MTEPQKNLSMPPARECWKLLERESKPKHKRTSHVKARTGCITCKSRRVKCDEEKPACIRCKRAGVTCEGYLTPSKESKALHARPQACNVLQSTKPVQIKPKRNTLSIATNAPTIRACFLPVNLSGQDVAYLDAFRYHVIDDFNMWITPGFWDKLVMREFMENETIRHSILGLAAMTRVGQFNKEESDAVMSNLSTVLSQDQDEMRKFVGNDHQAAISHYSKAISNCRRNLLNEGSRTRAHDLKRLLISNIVFIIMEMMQGNIQAAIDLVHTGLQLLQAISSKDIVGAPDPELVNVQAIFKRFSMIGGLNPCPPEATKAIDDLSKLRHVRRPSSSMDARSWLEQWSELFQPLQPFMVKSSFGHHVTAEELREFRMNAACGLGHPDQWRYALETHLQATKDAQLRRNLILAKIQILITQIHLTYCENPRDSTYDTHFDEFREIVDLAHTFTDSEFFGRMRFTVDFNLLPWLGFTIAKCRNHAIRKYALDTFTKLVFRQGGWGNLGLIKALRAAVDIDDQWTNADGCTYEAAKYSWSLSRFDPGNRKIWVRFDPSPHEAENFMLVREVAVDY